MGVSDERSTVVVIYDIILTVEDDIRYFWPAKARIGAILFWLNRYLPLLSYGISLGLSLSVPEKVGVLRPMICSILVKLTSEYILWSEVCIDLLTFQYTYFNLPHPAVRRGSR